MAFCPITHTALWYLTDLGEGEYVGFVTLKYYSFADEIFQLRVLEVTDLAYPFPVCDKSAKIASRLHWPYSFDVTSTRVSARSMDSDLIATITNTVSEVCVKEHFTVMSLVKTHCSSYTIGVPHIFCFST